MPAEPAQLESVGGDEGRYDTEVRPALMRQAIIDVQDGGIEADIWKIEGIDRREDCEMIAKQARAGGRDGVGCVVLGRGANTEKVEHWLRTGAGVPRVPRLRDRPHHLVGSAQGLPGRVADP